jgi:hypothetical protein
MATRRQDSVSYDTKTTFITQVEYRAFQVAFDFFNLRLFRGSLPQVLMTLQRRAGMRGLRGLRALCGAPERRRGA